jgi:hypothetical protein
MTRKVQKTIERQTLDVVLAALGLCPDQEPEAGETPDFMASLAGRRIGVEVTMYTSTDTVDGDHRRRQVESEWDKLHAAARAFCSMRPELNVPQLLHPVLCQTHGCIRVPSHVCIHNRIRHHPPHDRQPDLRRRLCPW